MSQLTGDDAAGDDAPAGRRGLVSLGLLLGTLMLAGAGAYGITGRPLSAPQWVTQRAEVMVNDALDGQFTLRLGSIELFLESGWRPRLRLRDITIEGPDGVRLGELQDLRFRLRRDDLIALRLRPDVIEVRDAEIYLRRLPDGRLDLDLGAGGAFEAVGSMAELMSAIDTFFEEPFLNGVQRASVSGVDIQLDDKRLGRVWEAGDGRLLLQRNDEGMRVGLDFELGEQGASSSTAHLSFDSPRGSPAARFHASLRGVPAQDIAVQAPALAWLSVLDAPVSGELDAEMDASGGLKPVTGELTIGAGAVSPVEGTPPVPFSGAGMRLAYDPSAERVTLEELHVQSRTLRLSATGQAYLRDTETGLPEAVEAQFRVSDLAIDPAGVFAAPVSFSDGMADVRLRLDPLTISIGQVTLTEGEERLRATGRIAAGPEGWTVAVDTTLNHIGRERLIALWPVSIAGKTRSWLDENVFTANLSDVKTAVRLRPGQEPRLSLSYEFHDADVRFLPTLPPIRRGSGYAAIDHGRYAMMINSGEVEAPQGGALNVAGTTFVVPDIEQKPAPARIDLRATGSITAALSLLDEPPFRFLSKANKPVDLAEGQASVAARLALPLVKNTKIAEVDYDVAATLTGVRSEKIVPGRVLESDSLNLIADKDTLRISGPGRLSGVPFTGEWVQPLAKEKSDHSTVTGRIALSPRAVEVFAPGLPADLVAGSGQADVSVDLRKGEPPAIRLESDLSGLSLRMPELGWSMARGATGRLAVDVVASEPSRIPRLSLSAPGLSVEDGSVTFKPGGTLDTAAFGRVKVGNWLDAPVTLSGRGRGAPPGITVKGGRLDLRALPDAGGGSSRSGGGTPISLALDRLQVSDGLYLSGVKGSFDTAGGLHGDFQGLVNGRAPLSGRATATGGARPALRLQASDAGAVIAAAGISPQAVGGRLDLSLVPRAAKGEYDGRLAIGDLRLRDAPTLAQILSAISVVGLVEQLSGDGIVFNEVRSDFRLTPGAVEVKSASATGASLGISAAGVYLLGSKRIAMQGVVSPLYLLNGIGAALTRRGEGLIGINYAVSGTADRMSVSVNPLSILTPGMFRDLFRSDPPRLAQ